MSDKLFIQSVSYNEASDIITVVVSVQLENIHDAPVPAVQVDIKFDEPTVITCDVFDQTESSIYSIVRHDAVLIARLLTKLDELTTEDTAIDLVIDVEEPIEF